MTRVVGVIPARWGSTRFPGKSLAPIMGTPLIEWVLARARQARRLDDVLVATDDERIYKHVSRLGASVVMTGSHHQSGTDRIAEAVHGIPADVIINIQGDEPLIDPRLIDQLAEAMLADPSLEMATAARPIMNPEELSLPSVVKVVWDGRRRALYFSRAVIPYVRNADAAGKDPLHWCHIGIYAYRRDFLEKFVHTPPTVLERVESLEQLRALHMGAKIMVIPADQAGAGVDTPEDVARVEDVLRRMGS
jgi:3-deoxy-manno-octulosonate cytidylyltransferase (CMP-KDO synthetase)